MTNTRYDVVIVGGGVVGASAAYHALRLGTKRVALVERNSDIANGTSAQSSGIVRTHYSVPENVVIAQAALRIFEQFSDYVGDAEASCGFNRCGYLIVGKDDARGRAIGDVIAHQHASGIDAQMIDAQQARSFLPLLDTRSLAHFGYEPNAGYADATMTAAAFARNAKRLGADIFLNTTFESFLRSGERVVGVRLRRENLPTAQLTTAHVVVCANAWTPALLAPLGVVVPVVAQVHEVVALAGPEPYLAHYPVYKDISSDQMLYGRSYGRTQLLASPGTAGPEVSPELESTSISLDAAATIGMGMAEHLPLFAEAAVASSWTGLYDVSPDWNPILGAIDGLEGISIACGFSGHGFKLSPVIGKLLAQHALGLTTDVSLTPYALSRFTEQKSRRLIGRYGTGAVS